MTRHHRNITGTDAPQSFRSNCQGGCGSPVIKVSDHSALDQVIVIHSGMAAKRAGLVSSQARLMEAYFQIHIQWLGESEQLPRLSPDASG
ncbi:hypothetical protein TNCV_4948711 [Trichonephila clavipes]|nr:hypothetical protein TNCV_4948711 [Trichonephila clavipes]